MNSPSSPSVSPRVATCAVAAVAIAGMSAAPARAQDQSPPGGSIGTQSVVPGSLTPDVDAASVEQSVSFMLLPVTDPIGSLQMGWESLDCFVVFPWEGPSDNCWY